MSVAAEAESLRERLARRLEPLASAPADSGGHTAAAVLVGLVERSEGYGVLLTRRSDALRRHAGQVALPGGRCDPGETAAQTALREAWEEIGLDPAFVTPAGQTSPLRTSNTGYYITPVVGFVRPGFTLSPNPAEVAVIFEAPFAFLMDPQTFQEQERDFGQGLRRFYAATHQDQLIWGATAQILIGLRRRLYD